MFATAPSQRFERVVTATAAALCLASIGLAAWANFCAFTWDNLGYFDFGVYTNMIWNSGHGRLFQYHSDVSYLQTHLAFTLALLGPLYRIWDHPLLLMGVQVLFLGAGCGLLARSAVRRNLGPAAAACLALFFTSYFVMQSVQVSPFHSVMAYTLLVPWLYYCMQFRKPFVWMPLLLICGLREEAALVVAPMLIYFAVKDRWRAGYLYAALAVAYSLAAILVIYPAINDASLFARRSRMMSPGNIGASFDAEGLRARAVALFWVALPALPFLRRWRTVAPFITFLLVPLAMAMGSASDYYHGLKKHYGAAVMVLLALALVEAFAAHRERGSSAKPLRRLAVYVLCVFLAGHVFQGFLPGGGNHSRIYRYVHPKGLAALRAVEQIPRDGVLFTPTHLGDGCANRAVILTWRKWPGIREGKYRPDILFFELADLVASGKELLLDAVEGNVFGVRYFDGNFVVMERGLSAARNEEVLRELSLQRRTIHFRSTAHQPANRCVDIRTPEGKTVRYWKGNRSEAPVTAAHGVGVLLSPGQYTAAFHLRVQAPPGTAPERLGELSLHPIGQGDTLARAWVHPSVGQEGAPGFQSLEFTLDQETRVEPRVTGLDAELWLDRVVFERSLRRL